MKWSYDLSGAEPIIKDEVVYDATNIANGELLMVGTSAYTAGADAGYALISAVPSTVMANVAINAVGISLESKTTADVPSIATAANSTASHCCYVKTIINPWAVYRAAVGTTTADSLAVASSASTNKFAVTGIPASAMDGSWVFFCASAGPNFGAIRKITSSATAGTQNIDAVALATITTADRVVIISERNKLPHAVSADATTIGQTTVAGYGCTNLRVVENYIGNGAYGGGIALLRKQTHSQTDMGAVQAKTTKFYQEIMMKDHLFGADL